MATSIIIPKLNGAATAVSVSVNGTTTRIERGSATSVNDDILEALKNSGVEYRLASVDLIGVGNILIPGTGARIRLTIEGVDTALPVGVPFAADAAMQARITARGITFFTSAGIVVPPIDAVPTVPATPAAAAAPVVARPTVSPVVGPIGQAFVGTDVNIAGSVLSSRFWVADGVRSGTGPIFTPVKAGLLVYQNVFLNPNGSTTVRASLASAVIDPAPALPDNPSNASSQQWGKTQW